MRKYILVSEDQVLILMPFDRIHDNGFPLAEITNIKGSLKNIYFITFFLLNLSDDDGASSKELFVLNVAIKKT